MRKAGFLSSACERSGPSMRAIIHVKTFSRLVTLALIVSCGSSTESASFTGNYVLVSVGSQAVPVTLVSNASELLQVLSGSGSLNADHSFSLTLAARESTFERGDQRDVVQYSGTWSASGSQLSFVLMSCSCFGVPMGSTVLGNVAGGTLRIVVPFGSQDFEIVNSDPYTFQRQ